MTGSPPGPENNRNLNYAAGSFTSGSTLCYVHRHVHARARVSCTFHVTGFVGIGSLDMTPSPNASIQSSNVNTEHLYRNPKNTLERVFLSNIFELDYISNST